MSAPEVERPRMDVDLVCVGFGPATAGFLTVLSRGLVKEDGSPAVESAVSPGAPPQVLCYERADDVGFGVSGVVTKARAIRETIPDLDPAEIPMTAPVGEERLVYLLDPHGASRRGWILRMKDSFFRATRAVNPWYRDWAVRLPIIPPFLAKHGGLVTSLGQFLQWANMRLMATGLVQVWPASPVAAPVVEGDRVVGVRLADQGVDRKGAPAEGYAPGMEIRAALTVVGDGPVGPVGRILDERFGLPEGGHRHDWAVGMKMTVELRDGAGLAPGTVLHTFGYPEPEIFGFLYVYPDRVASLGIFVPSWFDSPVRTAYRYLQHWILHPYLHRHLAGATLRSWGAKTLQESGRRGEPRLVGDGFARIGEGSGSTNVLTGSGVDEAWATGAILAEGVLELMREKAPFTRENLERAYVARRRAHRIDRESRAAARARDGFGSGFVRGMIGTALAGMTNGLLYLPGRLVPPHRRYPTVEGYFGDRIPAEEIARIRRDCAERKVALHDALMTRAGWPEIPYDGRLLVSHQDALLLGGKVQAPGGYADHVAFLYPHLCASCTNRTCVEICSGEAIAPGEPGAPPAFDREKCVHCGACLWSCSQARPDDPERSTIEFRAGAGGLHSAEN